MSIRIMGDPRKDPETKADHKSSSAKSSETELVSNIGEDYPNIVVDDDGGQQYSFLSSAATDDTEVNKDPLIQAISFENRPKMSDLFIRRVQDGGHAAPMEAWTRNLIFESFTTLIN